MAKEEKPCFEYQRTGSCSKGNKCKYRHDDTKPLCKNIASGKCTFGAKCRFSHDLSGTTPFQQPTAEEREAANTESAFRAWRRDIPLDVAEARPLYAWLSNFFQQAQKLAAIERAVTQEVITALASDGGLHRIGELVGRQFDSLNENTLNDIFRTQVIPFFGLLSHQYVDRSALLESRVAGIYTFIFSPNGQRAVALFTATHRFLRRVITLNATDTERETTDCCLFVMAKVMEINGTAHVTEPFVPIIESIAALFEAAADGQEPFSRPAYRNLRKIQQRLNIGMNIPKTVQTAELVDKPTFVTVRDLPGNLSDEGPRHDNDHASIRDIKIMPTLSEISAPRSEYLPSFDPEEWHVEGIEGLLDRHFRLVREDTVGQLRDAVKSEMERLQDPVSGRDRKDRTQQRARTFIYDNLRFENFGFDDFKGLEFAVSFDQPFDFRNQSESERRQTWNDSKRLGTDALVCLVDAGGAATFLIVSTPFGDQASQKSHRLHQTYTRHQDPRRAHAILRFADYNKDTAKQVISFFDSNNRRAHMELVEFPGVLVPAFQPTLAALQKMSTALDLPFADLILQRSTGESKFANVLPPEYATSPGFSFDLKSASTNHHQMHLKLHRDGTLDNFDMEAFKQSTSLDSGQADALISSLSRSFAITQGPPGTGKSYTGIALTKVLLDNKKKARLGPLILVSYTNHALDQMLEHLVDAGVRQIIRIGSRSKSEKLSDLNLRKVARGITSTKTEKTDRYNLRGAIKVEGQLMVNTLQELSKLGLQPSIENHLLRTNPKQHSQLFELVDDQGFQTVDYHPETRLARWLSGTLFAPATDTSRPRCVAELTLCNLRSTSLQERYIIHQSWVLEIKRDLRLDLARSLHTYNELKAKLDLIRTENDLRAVASANIIGVTTSGLARNLNLLRKLSSKVLISEEAGEVHEAHLLTAMLPSIEHVILIGDHLQLRPQVQNWGLSSESQEGKQYCLDISLFERLVKPLTSTAQALPFSTLEVQRRMHPSIANLIRSTLYPNLQDATSVAEYPEVSGMRRRLFWMNHEHQEDGQQGDIHTTSKTNEWEADMTAALVRHIVRQGLYKPSEIAVLTPYLGQLRRLRNKLNSYYEITLSEGDALELGEGLGDVEALDDGASSHSEDGHDLHPNVIRRTLVDAVRLSTIDNFQGEEATVVIISLVRCNENNNPGFLRLENRCNVLLSRAKHGMYVIGNAKTAGTVTMWADVLSQLQPNNIGDKLELCCPRHPDKILEAAEPDELFQLAPAGGCGELCKRQLKCGHACPEHCHSDLLHDDVYCLKDCTRVLKCQHPCPNPCGARCPDRCEAAIEDYTLTLECGHVLKDPPCWQVHELDKITCNEPVLKSVPGCNHTVLVSCSVDVLNPIFVCTAECGALLPCGHKCQKPCVRCNKKENGEITTTNHGACRSTCGRDYTVCRHSCSHTCHPGDPCPPCKATCEVRCKHSQCSRPCSEPCVPCAEEVCPSQCPHQICQMPCGAPCDWIPCGKRCSKFIDCGCQCPSLCGEMCPDERFCQNHGDGSILSQVVDYIEFNEYRYADLDSDPVLVLDCGHVFTVSTLDGLMDMAKYYELDEDGSPVTIKESNTLEFSKEELKSCPDCRGSLRNVARYGRIVRRALLDESTKKFICWSNAEYIPIARRMMTEQDALADSAPEATLANRGMRLVGDRTAQIVAVQTTQGSLRYGNIFGARRLALRFHDKVQAAEQPFQRVRDLVEAIRRKKAGEETTIAPFDFDQSLLQTRASLLAFALLLRCDLTIVSDVIATRNRTEVIEGQDNTIEVDFRANRLDCEKLILEANKSSHKLQEVEGHIFWARFAALERNVSPSDEGITIDGEETPMERLRTQAVAHLDVAEAICNSNASQTSSVVHEIEPTRDMLRALLFYTPVSSDEMRAVVAAMANELHGTGHWYRCVNGHLFAVADCGRPMETSRCPECGAGVGGLHHQAVEGVTRADDIDEEFVRMRI